MDYEVEANDADKAARDFNRKGMGTENESLSALYDIAEQIALLRALLARQASSTPSIPSTTAAPNTTATFTVFLANAGANKIDAIKALRELTGLGLKEAKDLIEAAPTVLREGVPKVQAEQMRKEFLNAGATIELRPCDR